MKDKLTIEKQIEYMRNENNISFSDYPEEKAIDFLTNNNYFFRLKAYAKLYEKSQKKGEEKKYIDLRFSQLVELSKIDLYIRQLIINITLSIEHSIKVEILRNISIDDKENGFEIVKNFFSERGYRCFSKIENKYDNIKDNPNNVDYSSNLVKKYFPNFPVWVLLEIIDFGDLIEFYSFYYYRNSTYFNLFNVKKLRNACAHNNCLLPSLKTKSKNSNQDLINTLNVKFKFNPSLSRNEISKLKRLFIKDFIVMIIVCCDVIKSDKLRAFHMKELKNLFDNIALNSKKVFEVSNESDKYLIESFNLIRKIIDKYYERSI